MKGWKAAIALILAAACVFAVSVSGFVHGELHHGIPGKVLNACKGNEHPVGDFVMFQ